MVLSFCNPLLARALHRSGLRVLFMMQKEEFKPSVADRSDPRPPPSCHNMIELPDAAALRAQMLNSPHELDPALAHHLRQGLAYTTGAALGESAPSRVECLAAFTVPNKAGLTAGGRAWQKHAHRSGEEDKKGASGWWGRAHGSVLRMNECSLELFHKVVDTASWHNLHWLPHRVLVYEMRVPEGYGMRWSQDRSSLVVPPPDVGLVASSMPQTLEIGQAMNEEPSLDQSREVVPPWVFRGFVEPMMENGHEVGWRH